MSRESGKRRVIEQRVQGNIESADLPHPRHHLKPAQGVAAQGEEVVARLDVGPVQHLRPDVRQHLLEAVLVPDCCRLLLHNDCCGGIPQNRLFDRDQFPGEKFVTTQTSLNLSARGFWKRPCLDEHHCKNRHLMRLRHRLSDGSGDRLQIEGLGARLHLLHHHKLLFIPFSDRECRSGSRPERRMALLDCPFDVVRIVIAAPDDDEVFQSAGDEQFPVFEEPEISGPEEGPLSCHGK